MNDQNPHNQRLRSTMVGYFADWHQLEKIWTSAQKLAASQAATDALDDFLKEHSPQSRFKSKE